MYFMPQFSKNQVPLKSRVNTLLNWDLKDSANQTKEISVCFQFCMFYFTWTFTISHRHLKDLSAQWVSAWQADVLVSHPGLLNAKSPCRQAKCHPNSAMYSVCPQLIICKKVQACFNFKQNPIGRSQKRKLKVADTITDPHSHRICKCFWVHYLNLS